jgi:hypothetical protein
MKSRSLTCALPHLIPSHPIPSHFTMFENMFRQFRFCFIFQFANTFRKMFKHDFIYTCATHSSPCRERVRAPNPAQLFYDAVYNRHLSYRGQCLTIHQLIYSYVTVGIHSSFIFNINPSVTHLDLL